MLDEFSPADMRTAVAARNAGAGNTPRMEVSGGVTLASVRELAAGGRGFCFGGRAHQASCAPSTCRCASPSE